MRSKIVLGSLVFVSAVALVWGTSSSTQAQAIQYPNTATFTIGTISQNPALGFSFQKVDGIALPNCTGIFATTLFLDGPNTTAESRTTLMNIVFTAKSLSRPVTVTYRVVNGTCALGAVSFN